MGIPDHLIASWEICVQVKKQQLELDMEQQTGSKSGKECIKAVYCHPAYVTCWRRLLRVPWTARRSNQSIPKALSPEYSLEGLKMKFQYFGHLMWKLTNFKRAWCQERLKAGGEGYNRGWDGWMASPIRWIWVWASSGSWWWAGKTGMLQSMASQSRTQLNWTDF